MSQANEVHQHNPWLTYGIGMHRIREAGLGTDVMEMIKQPMSLDDIHELCMDLFDEEICHPKNDWAGFVTNLEGLVKQEELIWNPVKNKLCPWIDLEELESIYRKRSSGTIRARFKETARVSPDPPKLSQKSTSFHHGSKLAGQRRGTESDIPKVKKSTSFHPNMPRKNNTNRIRSNVEFDPPSEYRKSMPQPNHSRSSSLPIDPPPTSKLKKAQSFHKPRDKPRPSPQRTQSFHTRVNISKPGQLKSSVVIKDELRELLYSSFENDIQEKSITALVKEWSHDENGQLRPLKMLLFEVPVLMPPSNPLIEHHEYFDSWKVLNRDSFIDEDGNEDNLVLKIARRSKLFLHPDKWPLDLNYDQRFLLQSIWDVFQKSPLF